MAPRDGSALTASRARLDRARRLLLWEIRAARLLGVPSWELAEDANALHRAVRQLLALLACAP